MDYVKNQFVDFIIKVMIYPLIYYLPSMFYFLNNDSFSIGRIRNCINSLISVLEKKGVKICNRKRMFDFNEIQNSGCFFCTIAFSVVVLISNITCHLLQTCTTFRIKDKENSSVRLFSRKCRFQQRKSIQFFMCNCSVMTDDILRMIQNSK